MLKVSIICLILLQILIIGSTIEFTIERPATQIHDYNDTTIETKGWIINSQARKFVKNILKQMPCGWPDLNVSSLAPYTNPDLELHLIYDIIESSLQFIRFKLEGLNDMIIKDLKVSYTFNKLVKFHFQFSKLKTTSAFLNMQFLIDSLEEMGIKLKYDGSNGPLELTLENLSIKGSFKYKMPIFKGSVKIYKFNAIANLDKVISNISNILNNDIYNKLLNEQIEKLIPDLINNNPNRISEEMEKLIVPHVNAFLHGKNLWNIIAMVGASDSKCKPTPAPWLRRDESDLL